MSRIAERAYGDDLLAYPDHPGFKTGWTSKEAAHKIAGKASTLREKVYGVIAAAGPAGLTADQAAAMVDDDWRAVRPRCSELAKAGRIVKTGERRRNDTGLAAAVWKAKL